MQNDPAGWGARGQAWGAQGQSWGTGQPQAGWSQASVQHAYGQTWGQAAPAPQTCTTPTVGDAAGEHLRMQRGRYDANVYVFFAFLFQMAIVGLIFGGIPSLVLASLSPSSDLAVAALLILGIPSGGAAAYFTFRDRWKCIEAFSSRFCSGVMNLSLLYVPIVALVYANVRGFQKLAGR